MSSPKLTAREPHHLMNAANTVAVIVSWMAGHDIEWIALHEGDSDWTLCPHPPELWDWTTFEYRLKPS